MKGLRNAGGRRSGPGIGADDDVVSTRDIIAHRRAMEELRLRNLTDEEFANDQVGNFSPASLRLAKVSEDDMKECAAKMERPFLAH